MCSEIYGIIITINVQGAVTVLQLRQTAWRLLYACACIILMVALFGTNWTQAVGAAAIGQSFATSDTTVAQGAIMSLKKDEANTVQLANRDRAEQLVGIVGSDPLIELTDNSKSVQIVTSGVTAGLVSDINGEVKTGDKITASPIEGVGMKATTSTMVVGVAQADLTSVKTSTRQVKDNTGQTVDVKVGTIPIQVNITFFATADDTASFLPSFLRDFANGVAGKDVSPVRVLIAATLLLLAFVSIAVLLYASVRSSIISIGRNPLSEVSVRKGLFQIGGISVAILLLTLITIYLILTT